VLSAALSGFITYVFLEPLFVPVGLDLAMVALWVLSISAGSVGMCLGVLLPTILPGICFGVPLSLLVGAFIGVSYALYLPIAGGTASLIGILLSTRYVTCLVLSLIFVS
jgi:callose synthase